MNDVIAEKLKLLPSSPGVYRMYDKNGEVIYVGKAISLKNRVRQYFHDSKAHTPKVLAMVSHIEDFEVILCENETEALSLESNLIKRYKPKYNILLKDDKHFPYVRIDFNKDFPQIKIVRRIANDGARYLGPFLSAITLREALNIVREHFPVRYCTKDLDRARARRERPCLMHHIGKCCAPCSGEITPAYYHEILESICSFLMGNTGEVTDMLTKRMEEAAEALAFERAAQIRDTIRAVERLSEKQVVIRTNSRSIDVFAESERNGNIMVFAMFVRDGKVIGTEKYTMDSADETPAEIMGAFLKQYYAEMNDIPPEILTETDAAEAAEIAAWLSERANRRINLHTPERGDKAKLTALALENCKAALEKEEILRNRAFERGEGAVAELSAFIGLDSVPARIECYDNSHLMGRETVSSMVVFTDGQPDKKAYRRFKIQSDAGGDDLIAMREVLTRRAERLIAGDNGFGQRPDLLVIDGGETQLNTVLEVLESYSLGDIPAIALAESHELIYLPGDSVPRALPRNSAALHLLERLRDEAHRFAISYHRSLHQKNALYSVLDKIDGIGEKRKRALFDSFMTLDAIKSAGIDELKSADGMNLPSAEAVFRYFHPDASQPEDSSSDASRADAEGQLAKGDISPAE